MILSENVYKILLNKNLFAQPIFGIFFFLFRNILYYITKQHRKTKLFEDVLEQLITERCHLFTEN